jgi:methionyl-tRNA formyltransferase
LAYLGTPEVGVPPLRALVADGHDVRIVVSRADKRRGRGRALLPSPVKAAALELGLPVTDRIDDILEADVELAVVVAFGRLIKQPVLDAVPMINMHFSLLPRWRGAAPVERAILAGDLTTGVGIMGLEEGLDTGPIYAEHVVQILPHETAAELRIRLTELGTSLLLQLLRNASEGRASAGRGLPEPRAQEGEPTYAQKLSPEELRLDWAQPPEQLERVVRVGGAWTTFRGKRLKVHRARVSDGELELLVVQPEGKGRMTASEWARGARWQPDEALGS